MFAADAKEKIISAGSPKKGECSRLGCGGYLHRISIQSIWQSLIVTSSPPSFEALIRARIGPWFQVLTFTLANCHLQGKDSKDFRSFLREQKKAQKAAGRPPSRGMDEMEFEILCKPRPNEQPSAPEVLILGDEPAEPAVNDEQPPMMMAC